MIVDFLALLVSYRTLGGMPCWGGFNKWLSLSLSRKFEGNLANTIKQT